MEGKEVRCLLDIRLPGSSKGRKGAESEVPLQLSEPPSWALLLPSVQWETFVICKGPREGECSPAAPTGSMTTFRSPPGRSLTALWVRLVLLSSEPCSLLPQGPRAGYILPGLISSPRGSRPAVCSVRGTCWADVGFPRPPSQRSQTLKGAPWLLLLRAGGKWRRQVSNSSGGGGCWPKQCLLPPTLPTQ